jgi:Transposase DDE domain
MNVFQKSHDASVAERGALEANRRPDGRPKRRGGRSKSWSEVELWRLPEAGRFSADPALRDPLRLIAEWRQQPFAVALRELADTSPTSLDRINDVAGIEAPKLGRPRLAGDWPAAYLAYVLSGCRALQPWYNQGSSSGLWEICGFDSRPSYQIVHLRFTELEEQWTAFAAATQDLIRHAKAAEPRIGEIVFVDATGWKSPAVLEHACSDEEACARAGGKPAAQLRSDSVEEIREFHWDEAKTDPDQDPDPGSRTRGELVHVRRPNGAVVPYRRFTIKGHAYRSLDTSSGLRRYAGAKTWFGGYYLAAADIFTGLPLAAQVFAADVQEWDGYPALARDLLAALDEPPYVVSVDKGFATRPFYEFNSRRGIAVVGPWRKHRNRSELRDWRTDRFDEHGIPRCQSCGGEGDQDAPGMGLFFDEKDEPRIRFRCVAPFRPECKRTQSIPCSEEWLMLVPLSRKTGLYHDVRYTRPNLENTFRHGRDRFAIAGKDLTGQLARPGVPPQRLRAWAGLLLDWFRLNLRQGWLEPIDLVVEPNEAEPERLSGLPDRSSGELTPVGVGAERLGELLRERDEARLELPYGRAWEDLKRERRLELGQA